MEPILSCMEHFAYFWGVLTEQGCKETGGRNFYSELFFFWSAKNAEGVLPNS
jgi:hypothetical protein